MKMSQLGETGLMVSRLGAGLAEIGSLEDEAQAERVLNAALDGGVNFLDTAACYGRSEEWIGRTVAHRRQEFVLATKAGHGVGGYDGEAWTARTILDSIDRSLERMNTDYVDLVQLHSCGVEILERGEVIQALLDAKAAGKTRFIGYSGDHDAALWAIDSGSFDTLQTTFNLVDQEPLKEVLPRAKAKRMGVIIKRPIANAAWRDAGGTQEAYRQRWQAMQEMGSLSESEEDPLRLALGFTLAHKEVDTAIVGTRDPAHMEANIKLVDTRLPISDEVVQELQRRYDRLG